MADARNGTRGRPVRPRVLWAGVGLAVLGMVVLGWGLVAGSALWTWAGTAAVVVGLLVAWRGGVLNDAQAEQPLGRNVQDAVHGNVHEGISPEARVERRAANERAAAVTQQTRERLLAVQTAPTPPLRPVATLALLVLGGWLVFCQFGFGYPYTVTGQNSGLRDLGFALVLVLSGFWLRHVGPSRVVLGLCLLAGILLLLSGVFLPHQLVRVQWNELVVGAGVLLAAAVAAGSETA